MSGRVCIVWTWPDGRRGYAAVPLSAEVGQQLVAELNSSQPGVTHVAIPAEEIETWKTQ